MIFDYVKTLNKVFSTLPVDENLCAGINHHLLTTVLLDFFGLITDYTLQVWSVFTVYFSLSLSLSLSSPWEILFLRLTHVETDEAGDCDHGRPGSEPQWPGFLGLVTD